jgi:hypothetical protein
MRSNGLSGPHRQLGQLAARHAILRGKPACTFTGYAGWRTPLPDHLPGGGPLNTPCLLCVLVVDGGFTGAPWPVPVRGAVPQQ